MRRGNRARVHIQQCGENRLGQRRALGRVGARAQLVKEHERIRRDLREDAYDVRHVSGEGRKRLLDGLFVADVGEHVVKDCQLRAMLRRHLQAGLRHQRKQTGGLERHGLAAGVRAGDDQRGEVRAQTDVQRNDLLRIDQRMAAPTDVDAPLVVDLWLAGHHLACKRRLGKREVELRKNRQIVSDGRGVRRDLRGECAQNPVDLRFLGGNELLELVADLHDGHRLHEDRRTRGGLIVDDARHHAAVFLLDRQHIAVGAHGDDGLLEVFLRGRAVDHAIEPLADALVAGAHLAADGEQLRARAVGDLLLTEDRVADGLLQRAVR